MLLNPLVLPKGFYFVIQKGIDFYFIYGIILKNDIMKKISILGILFALLLSGCQSVSRTYAKNATGVVTVVSHCEDGTTTTENYTNPTVKSLKKMGLSEQSAVQLIANGTSAQSVSSEPTTLGWVVIVIIVIILIIMGAASGDGFFLGMLVADALDD